MKKIVLILMMFLGTSLFANNDFTKQEFWQIDKKRHFGASVLMASTITATARYKEVSKFDSFLYGVAGSVTIGLLKEVADGHRPLKHTEDIGDLYANVLGAVAGSLLTFEWKW